LLLADARQGSQQGSQQGGQQESTPNTKTIESILGLGTPGSVQSNKRERDLSPIDEDKEVEGAAGDGEQTPPNGDEEKKETPQMRGSVGRKARTKVTPKRPREETPVKSKGKATKKRKAKRQKTQKKPTKDNDQQENDDEEEDQTDDGEQKDDGEQQNDDEEEKIDTQAVWGIERPEYSISSKIRHHFAPGGVNDDLLTIFEKGESLPELLNEFREWCRELTTNKLRPYGWCVREKQQDYGADLIFFSMGAGTATDKVTRHTPEWNVTYQGSYVRAIEEVAQTCLEDSGLLVILHNGSVSSCSKISDAFRYKNSPWTVRESFTIWNHTTCYCPKSGKKVSEMSHLSEHF
jgi:hypothetical protein